MSEFDPEVLKRSLPPDIHGTIDQVTQNVKQAVGKIVGEFRSHAEAVVKQFESQNFSAELEAEIKKHTTELQNELRQFDTRLVELSNAAAQAAELAQAANAQALRDAVNDLKAKTGALQTRLKDFRDKTETFGRKTGGAIATAAFKSFTGGLA
jgi:Sec-independent protein translocase protein TatA